MKKIARNKPSEAQVLLKRGDTWTDMTTRLAFPIVLQRALDGSPITYSNLRQAIINGGGIGGARKSYGHVAGKIGDICNLLRLEGFKEIPPINAIIINKITGLPSQGIDYYLETYLGARKNGFVQLSSEDRDAYAAQVMRRVLYYTNWLSVAARLGIVLPNNATSVRTQDVGLEALNVNEFATGPESEAHRRLKMWVSERFELFKKYGDFQSAANEHHLFSGDRLDVFFLGGQNQLAIEVKSRDASDSEVKRGVFQCIKYRETLRAMQLVAGQPPNAQAVLVLDRQPNDDVVGLAALLSIDIVLVHPGTQ